MRRLNKIILLMFLLSTAVTTAQGFGETLINGRAVADSVSTEGINVVNLVTKQSTITDRNGKFSILAKPGDLLVLSAVQFEYNRYLLEPEDFQKELVTIKMTRKINELEETVVNQYSHINAEALRIIPYGQKKYTPAERKLAAAQSGPVDILVNIFSGRLEMRKKEVEVEKKEVLLQRLEFMFGEEYYTNTLKLPKQQIAAFHYFAVEDADLANAITARNKIQTAFRLGFLAQQYLKLNANDN